MKRRGKEYHVCRHVAAKPQTHDCRHFKNDGDRRARQQIENELVVEREQMHEVVVLAGGILLYHARTESKDNTVCK